MRIAIPVEQGKVAHHVGHAPAFLIADVEDGQVVKSAEVPNPGHGPGGPPPMFLRNVGVELVIGWAMPSHAFEIFERLGLNLIMGAQGEAQQVLRDYLAGTLKTGDDTVVDGCAHADDC